MKNLFSSLKKKDKLRKFYHFEKFRFSTNIPKGSSSDNHQKLHLQTNHTYFINENSNVQNVVYKEEIFEYFALNYKKMTESELSILLDKISKFAILETELKDLKCFIRDFIEISNGIKDEQLITKFITFISNKLYETKSYLSEDNLENNDIIKSFRLVYNNCSNFIKSHMKYIKSNTNLVEVFIFFDKFLIDYKDFSFQFWKEILEIFRINIEIYDSNLEFGEFLTILKVVLNYIDKNRIDVNNLILELKFIFNEFNFYFKSISKDEIKGIFNNDNLKSLQMMNLIEHIFVLTNFILHNKFLKEKPTEDELGNIDKIKAELEFIFNEFKSILQDNQIDTERLIRKYSLEKEKNQTEEKLEDELYQEQLKILDQIKNKYI